MRWFVERVLRPGAFEPEPEPLARGGLAHAALKDTLEGLRRETGSARLTPARPRRAHGAAARRAAEPTRPSYPLSVAPERRPAVRRRLRADLERYLEHAAEARARSSRASWSSASASPTSDERGEASELPAFELGRRLRLRGRIDRIDVGADGAGGRLRLQERQRPAGRQSGSARASCRSRCTCGRRTAARRCAVVGGFYQPLSGEDLRARGAARRRQRGRDRLREDRRRDAPSAHASCSTRRSRRAARPPRRPRRGALEARPAHLRLQGRLQVPDDLPVRAMTRPGRARRRGRSSDAAGMEADAPPPPPTVWASA